MQNCTAKPAKKYLKGFYAIPSSTYLAFSQTLAKLPPQKNAN
jgi:hypothetical protein